MSVDPITGYERVGQVPDTTIGNSPAADEKRALRVDNGLTVTAGGLTVTGGLTVADTGLTVTAGGLTVTAGGLTVTAGQLRVAAARVIDNESETAGGTGTTLTAANIVAGLYESVPTANLTLTTDTATAIVAGIAGASVGDTIRCFVANAAGGAFTVTLAAGTGVTLRGNTAVAQSKVAELIFLITAVAPPAVTAYAVVSA